MYRLRLILLLLIVADPATSFAQGAAKGDPRKSVGVISNIGGKFALQKVGMTVFQNDLKEVPIEVWGIDDAVMAKVAQHMGKRYEVRKVAFAKTAFAEYDNPNGGLFRDQDAELRNAVRRIAAAAAQKSDLYLVVTRIYSKFSGTNQNVVGLGMVEASSILGATYNLHALFALRIYNGRTFEMVTWKHAATGPYNLFAIIKGPHRELDKTLWPASTNLAGNERLKVLTRNLVDKSLDVTLPELMGAN
jgi:hypothetical protein